MLKLAIYYTQPEGRDYIKLKPPLTAVFLFVMIVARGLRKYSFHEISFYNAISLKRTRLFIFIFGHSIPVSREYSLVLYENTSFITFFIKNDINH